MTILSRAPFLPILAGLSAMLGLYERAAYGGAVMWLPLAALLVALGTAASSFVEDLKHQWAVTAAVAVCVFASSLWIISSLSSAAPFEPYRVNTTGVVTDSRPWGRSYAAAVDTPLGGFLLEIPSEALSEGDVIHIEGTAEPLSSEPSGSGFREDRYWTARGVAARLAGVRTEPGAPGRSIHRWRHTLYLSLLMETPRLTGAYLNAAWTGKRDAMLDEAHRRWGTSHILAVSGFHVGVMMAAASSMFKRGTLRVPLLSSVLWLYVFLTGAPASAVRAGLMIQAGLLGELAGRPGSSVNSVSLAAVLLLLRSPFWFWDAGWRLSVLAALAIAVTHERWGSFGWRTWLFMNVMIWLASFPQVSWTFGGMPAAGLLINLAAPQFFGIALSVGSIAAALKLLTGASFFLLPVEGAFITWELLAGWLTRIIPWQLAWNPIISYCCAALFIMFTCRAFFIPWRGVIILSPMGALASFFLFAA